MEFRQDFGDNDQNIDFFWYTIDDLKKDGSIRLADDMVVKV